MTRILSALLLLSLGGSAWAAESGVELAAATIVVYNRSALESAGLARFYAQARGIPNDHLIGLECSTEEEISRQEYDATIAEPLRKIFAEQKWWTLGIDASERPVVRSSRIRFVAMIRGMPLKIRYTVSYPGDRAENNQVGTQNQAGVDSELATLGLFSRQISGPANNPYFQNFRPIAELEGAPILLVCRLDAPTAAIVRRMISDAVETEKNGLWGRAYVDGADHNSGGLAEGDEWLRKVAKDLRQSGVPVVYDAGPELFPAGFPMSDCALYYGWYAGGVAGPFTDPGFAFTRGAIAVHIHSFSANTLRAADANWVGPLLAKGAAASLGNVYEPFLQLTAHLDIFNDRLLHGFTLAESAYMSMRVVSWMNVTVGDPLYRPYANWLRIDAKRESRKKNDWKMYRDFAVRNGRLDAEKYRTALRSAATRAGNGAMLEDLGASEKESGDFAAAAKDLEAARSLYPKPVDRARTALAEVDALLSARDKPGALALIGKMLSAAPATAVSALFKKLEEQINPAPTPEVSP